MSIVLWPRMTHLVPMLSQNACCGWGAWYNSHSFVRHFLSLISVLLKVYNCLLKTGKRTPFLSPSDVYVRSFLCLLYFNKMLLHKKLWIIKPITSPGSNSSPLEATNPSIVCDSAPTFQYVVQFLSFLRLKLLTYMNVCVYCCCFLVTQFTQILLHPHGL